MEYLIMKVDTIDGMNGKVFKENCNNKLLANSHGQFGY